MLITLSYMSQIDMGPERIQGSFFVLLQSPLLFLLLFHQFIFFIGGRVAGSPVGGGPNNVD